MKLPEKKILLNSGLIFILIIVIGAGYYTYNNILTVHQTAESRKASLLFLEAKKKVLLSLQTTQDYQRVYLITQESDYLTNFYSSFTATDSLLLIYEAAALNSITSQEVKMVSDSMISSIVARLDQLYERVQSDLRGDKVTVIDEIKKGRGTHLMESIYSYSAILERYAFDNFLKTDEFIGAGVRDTVLIVLVATVLASLIFISLLAHLNNELNARVKMESEIRQEKEFSERLLSTSIDSILAFDRNLNITLFNSGIEALTGLKNEDVKGKNIYEIFPFIKEIGEDVNIKRTLNGSPTISKDKFFNIPLTGRKGYFEAYYSPIFGDNKKNVIGVFAILRNTTRRKLALQALERVKEDLEERVQMRTAELSKINDELKLEIEERRKAETALKISLDEKVVLLREIHHRVENNLQVISSLLNLQSSQLSDELSIEIFRESKNRVRSMALIHEKLYQTKDLNSVKFDEYVKILAEELFSSYNIDPSKVKINVQIDPIIMGIDCTVLCGLILNELISNCLKHAFPQNKEGIIYISAYKNTDGNFKISVKDNGIGFPMEVDYRNTQSLGLQLVNTLTDQLGGNVSLFRNGCTEFNISFSETTLS
jgi:PAS domain S-box-containing protein